LIEKIIVILTILCCLAGQLNAQSDSLTQILDDIQDENTSLNNWLEALSEQFIDTNKTSRENFPKISLSHRFQYTLEKNKALSKKIFIGSPFESYTRFRIKLYKNLSVGALIQKDVGEKSLLDHISGFISWNHPEYPLKIILGNYYIRCAEGLLLSGPFSLPKSALIVNPSSNRYLQARPFLSSNEYDGFWGGILEIGAVKSWKLITFYSHKLKDGILSDNNNFVTGFDRSGYHRTLSERIREDRLSEKTYGGMLSFPLFIFDQLGMSFINTQYSPVIKEISSSEERRRNFYKFNGSSVRNYSVFYAIHFRNLHFAGEIVPVELKKITYLSTLNFYHSNWHFVLKSWRIPSQFQSPFGRIPSDSNPFPKSIQGFMIGSVGKPLSDMKITTFWFHKKDLWRSYFQPLPLQKKEFYLQSEYRFGVKKYLFIRYHISSSNYYSSDSQEKTERTKHSFRVQIKQYFSTKVRFQSRLEKVILNFFPFQTSKKGINFYQDIYWQIYKPVTFHIRFSSFNTDDYDSRIYEYENDLPNVFSNYPLYGRGRKWYVMLTLKPTPKIKLWLKYRRIAFDDMETIGSGNTTINGNMRQDIHLQLEFRY
jgi:hypothetical protein